MKLGMLLGYSGQKMSIPIEPIKHAEALGYDSIWTAEAYGSDAVTPAAWILAQTDKIKVGTAIMQMPARTPAMCAMSNGKLCLIRKQWEIELDHLGEEERECAQPMVW